MAYISKVTTTDNNEYDIKSKVTAAIPYGECDSTSTATAFTATVNGITSLYDGVTVMLRNGVVTSASGFTININNLGAKPVYNNMATGNPVTPTNPTRDTTIFNINYTMLLVYDSNIVSGGGWICYRGYDGNTNTIGYQLRTNSGNLPASDTGYRYRLWLTSADGTKWVPINTSTSTNATKARTLNTRAIDPFGPIVYNSTNGTVNADARPSATALWQQYALTIGYSYVLSMTAWKPVYLQATPQTNGSAVMNALTQTLPSSKDGKIYIYLGIAYSATAMELRAEHPVYWHDGTGIRIWSGAEPSGGSSVDPSTATPLMDGTAAVGASTAYARGDHRHPSDTAKVDAVSSYSGFTGRITNTDASAKLQSSMSGITSTVEATGALAKMNAENLSENTSASVTLAYGEVRIQSTDGTYISNVQTPLNTTDAANKSYVDTQVATKQATLVSGTNIKTVNGNSLLGSGDLEISVGGGADTLDEVVISCGTIAGGGGNVWLPLNNVLLNNAANGTIELTETAIVVDTSVTYEFTIAWNRLYQSTVASQYVDIYKETSATATSTASLLYQANSYSSGCVTAVALKQSDRKWLRFRASPGATDIKDLSIRVRQLTKI